MRRSPLITKILQKYLTFESNQIDKPIVFLFHPNECLEIGDKVIATRRSNNYFEYIFADIIRQKLKLKNLGENSLKLLDDVLKNAKKYDIEFISIREYRKVYNGDQIGNP